MRRKFDDTSSSETPKPDLGTLWRCQEINWAPPYDTEADCFYPGPGSTSVQIHEYPIIRRTEKGAWIDTGWGQKKFVLLTARKKYACETLEQAKVSFIARKERQISILSHQIEKLEDALALAKNGIFNKPVKQARIWHSSPLGVL